MQLADDDAADVVEEKTGVQLQKGETRLRAVVWGLAAVESGSRMRSERATE